MNENKKIRDDNKEMKERIDRETERGRGRKDHKIVTQKRDRNVI